MRRARLAFFAVLACAKSEDSIGLFPCANDHTCPTGFACNANDVCSVVIPPDAPAPDAPEPLSIDTVGCSQSQLGCGSGLACVFDACDPPCNRDSDCGSGRLCTQIDQPGTGACELQCSVSQDTCPADFHCGERHVDGQFICLPGSTTLPACTSVTSASLCTTTLCGKASDYNVPCGAGHDCTHDTTCTNAATNTCGGCGFGSALQTCSGTLVTDASTQCPAGSDGTPDCWCVPTSQTPGCTEDHFQLTGTCVCENGSHPTFPCGDTMTCEQRCAL